MEPIKLTVLGSGSALPSMSHFHASQILTMRGRSYMIDCGEGTQIKMRQYGINNSGFDNIFISHLHSDHCMGLVGLISTMAMLGREKPITIHAYKDLQNIITPMLDYFTDKDSFKIMFNHINPAKSEVVFEDKCFLVRTIPLKHRVPSCGFLFEEKQGERHLVKEMIDAFQIPVKQLKSIKKGADFIDKEGFVVKNEKLTTPPSKVRKYAYISDTLYQEKIIPLIEGADCIFHESTFLEKEKERAKETLHSTALQAATIAHKANVGKLILGHYSARYRSHKCFLEEARQVFSNTILATDGLSIEI